MFHEIAGVVAVLHAFGFAATTTKKTSSSSSIIFFVLLLVVVFAYMWIRPQRRRLRQQQLAQRQFAVGDEVVTTSGIVGRVRASDNERVDLEIAPGTVIQVLPQAIARTLDPPASPDGSSFDGGGHPEDSVGDKGASDPSKWWPEGQAPEHDPESGETA